MKIGLYFGTYNPIHVGHLIIANYMADYTELDQVWLVVTPQNPLKEKSSLLADFHRLSIVKEAIDENPKLRVSDIEFNLSKPNYTVNTLTHLQEKFPEHEFALIMGEDNLRTLHKWFNFEIILNNHMIYVYPRIVSEDEDPPGDDSISLRKHPHVVFCKNAPVMNVSSTFVRQGIKKGKDVRYLLTEPVYKYIEEMHFYKN
jgi:nicotinate-nucleotide adenylyltransferase